MNASPLLLKKAARATVGIHSRIPPTHVSTAIGLGTERRGTGTIVAPNGLILTAHYILMGARSVMVTLGDGQRSEARVIAHDYASGLGLLKIEARDLPFLEVVSSETVVPGQDAFNVASVGGAGRCADSGIITYLGPFDALWEFALDRCVCMTASSLNIGLNGGPICNSRCEMVALSYLSFADLGRAILGIPGECFIAAREEMLRHGRCVSAPARAWMGVLSYTLREHVVIAGVMPGSPGEKAGLMQGDLVLDVDGREISERRAFYDALTCRRAGDCVRLKVMRDNHVREIQVPTVTPDDYFG